MSLRPERELVGPELVGIVAVTENGVIGRGGGMPWHLPADLAHFRSLSRGKPNIMGRKVWDSLGGRPLPGRENIVLTRNEAFVAPGAQVVYSPQGALAAAGDAPEVAIIGGAEVYGLFLPQLSRVELTLIHARLDGDTFLPELGSGWVVTQETQRAADDANAFDLTFRTLIRT
ncbi:dihydrofolate reductase [Deinococcus aquaticus]|uniref:Dihydrofolate reductase n=1 Tax=Deinococcus aquaticus TaxID=328692 RepID=A0ABY7V349_9DEIO|nr:dihydrofolate reductase [Deinococcus aquaticus]WDA59560.1 dihydrofolate reductase [Deinococcus aquaticus]